MKKLIIILFLLLSFYVSSYAGHVVWHELVLTTNGYILVSDVNASTIQCLDQESDLRICTLEYAPVCAEFQVQCVTTPCNPIQVTYGNACMAGDNRILYHWECNSYLDLEKYKEYQRIEFRFTSLLERVSTSVLRKAIDKIDMIMANIISSESTTFAVKDKITKYTFIKNIMQNELNSRN